MIPNPLGQAFSTPFDPWPVLFAPTPAVSKSFLTSLAQLDLPHPLGLEDLRGIDAAGGIWVEDGIDHVAAAGLV